MEKGSRRPGQAEEGSNLNLDAASPTLCPSNKAKNDARPK